MFHTYLSADGVTLSKSTGYPAVRLLYFQFICLNAMRSKLAGGSDHALLCCFKKMGYQSLRAFAILSLSCLNAMHSENFVIV